MRARVLIRPREEILDPEGQTIERDLRTLGFTWAENVRAGRMIELDVPDPPDPEVLSAVCETLLANSLTEDFEAIDEHGNVLASSLVRTPAENNGNH
jgi:phosphoribosylformylglycinamidine synthase subunit PurS